MAWAQPGAARHWPRIPGQPPLSHRPRSLLDRPPHGPRSPGRAVLCGDKPRCPTQTWWQIAQHRAQGASLLRAPRGAVHRAGPWLHAVGQPQPPGTALHAASRIWSCFLAQTPTFPGAGRRREHTWLTPSACAGPTSGSGRAAPCSSRCFALLLCFPEVHFRPAIGGDEAVTGAGSAPRRGVWQRGTKQCPRAAKAAR